MVHVIGISGKAGHGKSTAAGIIARILVDRYSREQVHRVPLAQALKYDVIGMGFAPEDIAEKPLWMRKLLQAYGQARRAVDANHWVGKVAHFVSLIDQRADRQFVIIEDVRFLNEASYVKLDALGHLLRVNRMSYKDDTPQDDSETQLDNYDSWDKEFWAASADIRQIEHSCKRFLDQIGLVT